MSGTRGSGSRAWPDSANRRRRRNRRRTAGAGIGSSSYDFISVGCHAAARLDLKNLIPPENRAPEEAGDEYGEGQGVAHRQQPGFGRGKAERIRNDPRRDPSKDAGNHKRDTGGQPKSRRFRDERGNLVLIGLQRTGKSVGML